MVENIAKRTILWSGLGLRLRSQFGLRVRVMANDLKTLALTHRRNRHPYPDLSLQTYFLGNI